jgi:hypothetical protein
VGHNGRLYFGINKATMGWISSLCMILHSKVISHRSEILFCLLQFAFSVLLLSNWRVS